MIVGTDEFNIFLDFYDFVSGVIIF